MTDWGVPDWRDADAYPKKLADLEWWWEFTRRHPDYRKLWQETPAPPLPVEEDVRFVKDVCRLRLEFQLSRLLDPRRSFSDLRLMKERHPVNYGHEPEHSPILDDPAHVLYQAAVGYMNKRAAQEKEAGIYHYAFDLSQPLPQQLKLAAASLKLRQERRFQKLNTRRPSPDLWALYLRALDAKDAEAKPTEMAAVFWPGSQKQRSQAATTLKRARAVRDNFPI